MRAVLGARQTIFIPVPGFGFGFAFGESSPSCFGGFLWETSMSGRTISQSISRALSLRMFMCSHSVNIRQSEGDEHVAVRKVFRQIFVMLGIAQDVGVSDDVTEHCEIVRCPDPGIFQAIALRELLFTEFFAFVRRPIQESLMCRIDAAIDDCKADAGGVDLKQALCGIGFDCSAKSKSVSLAFQIQADHKNTLAIVGVNVRYRPQEPPCTAIEIEQQLPFRVGQLATAILVILLNFTIERPQSEPMGQSRKASDGRRAPCLHQPMDKSHQGGEAGQFEIGASGRFVFFDASELRFEDLNLELQLFRIPGLFFLLGLEVSDLLFHLKPEQIAPPPGQWHDVAHEHVEIGADDNAAVAHRNPPLTRPVFLSDGKPSRS